MNKPMLRLLGATALLAASWTAQAATLTGSGLLPIPTPNTPISWVAPNYTPTSPTFQQGEWFAPAASPWIGGSFMVYNPSGALPTSMSTGEFRYDFTGLANSGGLLPVGTYFYIGDVDNGSGNNEVFHLSATDAGGTLLDEWLDEPIYATGSGLTASAMPFFTWDSGTKTYTFDGNAVPSNPNIAIYMESNQEMAFLSVDKLDTHYSFAILAPEAAVPVPAAAWLFGSGLIAFFGMARKRRLDGC